MAQRVDDLERDAAGEATMAQRTGDAALEAAEARLLATQVGLRMHASPPPVLAGHAASPPPC